MNSEKLATKFTRTGTAKQLFLSLCCALPLVSFICLTAGAQDQQRNAQMAPSELGQDNMSLVAASAADIKAVLVTDAGLIVELKRWVAKDATDHGQIIGEADLTEDAIFDRLETDVHFRSIATLLLQRYGYLVPKVNPDSAIGKEQELLVQERVKWLAQDQEEQLSAARQRTRNLEAASACDPQQERNCNAHQTSPSQVQNPGSQIQPGVPPSGAVPNQPVPQNPSHESGPPLERAQLMQNGGFFPGAFTQVSTGTVYDGQPLEDAGVNSFGPLVPQAGANDPDGQSTSFMMNGVAATSGGTSSATTTDENGIGSRMPSASQRVTTNSGHWNPALMQPVEMTRAANPYGDVPSLYDMYVQAAPYPSTPTRFGISVFENGTRDPELIPMDLPAGPDYIVGPGDGLAIDLWGSVSQRLYRTVDREGRVSLPEVGPVLVSGKNLADVQQNLQQVLRNQFRDVSADVSLARLRTIRVYVVGDVVNPGAYDISSLSTPLNALFVAGGPTPRGSLRIVRHYRGNQLVQDVDLYDLLLHGVKSGIERLDNGDTVLVPPIGPQVTVEGMVRRPAIYELGDEKDLASVLELAGGLLPTAALQHIEVQRTISHEKETMVSVDVPDGGDANEAAKKLASFEIHDGDRVRMFPIAPYNENAVYLEGHVIRPGRYSYHADMRVTDVIASYKDLLPEPAIQYAEIIRLNAPDFRPSVESFDLADAFANPAQAPVLHPMDTVRIFSRFDFENPPVVSVAGDVRNPGTYQTSGQIHLSDAVHLAGGLAQDAERGDAQVFRYLPDGKLKIFSVSLSQAIAGDPTENILLAPRDRVLVHQNPDATEPATVYVQGEVGKPGRYPLTTNMTVADLIRVGGGLTPSADTEAGDVTHYQWEGAEKLNGRHEPVEIAAALSGDPKANVFLHNGDVVTVRQLPGWNDLGASITVKGEVAHPGTYGIRPGERLSSILERAGGFEPSAYPYGAILQRAQVRELEGKERNELILRVKNEESNLDLLPTTDPKEKKARDAALAQYQTTLTQLSTNPPVGRVDIRISSKIERWKSTAADIEVRAGDTILIPKRPSYVMVTGQVFNPTAVSYRPGKSAKWYLSQSGGPTTLAEKKGVFVIRADGSVVGSKQGLWGGDSLSAVLQPGDTVVVPEKAIGGSRNWQNLFAAAQVASSVTSSLFIAAHY